MSADEISILCLVCALLGGLLVFLFNRGNPARDEERKPRDEAAFPAYADWKRDCGQGMSLLDWFAGQALAGELSTWREADPATPEHALIISTRCYTLARAMLVARDVSQSTPTP